MGRTIKFSALAACAIATVAATPATAQSNGARGWQCVTYARTITDVAIRGNANTWWNQAAGKYERGNRPAPGAVLAFKSAPGMRMGHVAVVKDIVSDRELIVDHANWTRRGGVEHSARVIDVSDAGDWSAVKVSYGQGMGTRTNPTFGFIYPSNGPRELAEPRVQYASATVMRAPLSIAADIRAMAEAESGR